MSSCSEARSESAGGRLAGQSRGTGTGRWAAEAGASETRVRHVTRGSPAGPGSGSGCWCRREGHVSAAGLKLTFSAAAQRCCVDFAAPAAGRWRDAGLQRLR